MKRLEVSGAVRPIYELLGVKRLKHLNLSYIFRSYDHPQGAYIVPCQSYSLKTLSDLRRYVQLVLWQRVLCIV